jgi:misacylated tRNA(Ala) deacylase
VIYSPKPLSPGDKIRQEIDWKRRWDHMQQHTGQHLLSAVMMKSHGIKTVGWGMGTDGCFNYVDLERKPSEDEMQAITMECAEKIRDNLSIKVQTPNDAKHDKLPGDYDKSDGVVRVISIGDLDDNTYVFPGLLQASLLTLTAAVELTSVKLRTSPSSSSAQRNLFMARIAVYHS